MNRSRNIGRARLSRSASALSLAAVLAFSTSAFAQTADAAAEEENEDIVVTGYAASLDNAVEVKRDAQQIVESVSAEDIGRLPDASIGEAIARLPGVTSQRVAGRASGIAVRGLGPDFSQTLLNGREQTSTGDNRAVEFDQYPSEIVNQVVVYKSPTASLVGQGMVGTIDIRTIRPLETSRRILAVGARASYADLGKLNAGSNDIGYRANATYVDQFADDTIGLSLAASYVNEPYQIQEFNAWGYAGDGSTGNPYVIGGNKSFVTSTDLERFGINGTLQWEPAPEVRVTFDGFYSHFNDDQIKRGIELPLGFGAWGATLSPTGRTIADGQVVAGTFTGVLGVVRNDIFQRKADLYSFGFNTAYEGDDGWNVLFDIGYSRTNRNELSLESYSGTGVRAGGTPDTIGFISTTSGTVFDPTINYSDPTRVFLTDPLGWGGGTLQAGYYNNRIIEDELMQYRVEVERELDNSFLSSIQLGLNYTNRDKSLNPDEFFVTLPNGALSATVPSQYLLRSTDLSYLGLGPIISYDARQLIADGVLTLARNNSLDIPAKAYSVSEDLMTAYLQVNIDTPFAGGDLTGNFGVQAINTDQESSGLVFVDQGMGRVATPLSLGDNYWDVLPSLNLSLRLESDTVIRFAAAREIQRPRLDDLRIALSYGVDNSVPGGLIRGGGGNPFLRPYRANAVDLNIEQYFGQGGLVALQLFYKDIKTFISGGRFAFDYAGFPTPIGATASTPTLGTLDTQINTDGGSLLGAELAATLPFSNFSSALEGFGITGGVGYTRSRINDAGGNRLTAIPGYSKWVANGTIYFERAGFNARASARYRSTFQGDFTGFGGSPTRRRALDETIIDAQIGYDFQAGSALEGLSLYLQGQNLTDERFASVASTSSPLRVIDYQIYGRRFLAGATFKF
ncbi:MAG: TonB-dependent receptor [Sphingopyxis sp.]